MAASLLAITFALAFDDKSTSFQLSFWLTNFLRILLIVIFSVLAKEIVRKLVASRYDCVTEYRIWEMERIGIGRHTRLPRKFLGFTIHTLPIGVILPILIAFISLGKIPFIASGVFIVSTQLIHRAGKKYLHLTEYEEAKIALSAVLTSLGIAFLFKFLTPFNPALGEVVTINAWLAFFHMLPLADLDGAKIFFAGKTFYVFNMVFVIASALMLSLFGTVATVILAIIFAIILAANYHYFLVYK